MRSDDRSDPRVQARWAVIRERALARDGYKCVVCSSPHNLEGHHLDGWKWFPNRRFAVDNIVTLCRKCHKRFHWWNGGTWRKCTAKGFNFWLRARRSSIILWYLNIMMYGIITLTILAGVCYAAYVVI